MVRSGSFLPISPCQDAVPQSNSKMSAVWFASHLHLHTISRFALSWSFTSKICHSLMISCITIEYCFKTGFYKTFCSKSFWKLNIIFENLQTLPPIISWFDLLLLLFWTLLFRRKLQFHGKCYVYQSLQSSFQISFLS